MPDEENICFLDCTRVSGMNELVSRNKESLFEQIERLARKFYGKKILLLDDVVFSGDALRYIINIFDRYSVRVVGVIASICTDESYEYFNKNLKFGLRCNYKMDNMVIDQICERDFYFGIAGSGIMINTENGLYKAPYFKPYGDPCVRASIPDEYELEFSCGCLERSIYLWDKIDLMRDTPTKILELPEKIINTDKEMSVVKTLRKELRKL